MALASSYKDIERILCARFIYQGLQRMLLTIKNLSDSELIDKAEQLKQNYALFSRTYFEGTNDEQRESIFRSLQNDALDILDKLQLKTWLNNLPYELANKRRENINSQNLDSQPEDTTATEQKLFYQFLFNQLDNLTTELNQLLNSADDISYERRLCIALSAVTLRNIISFAESDFDQLMVIYNDSAMPISVRIRAIVGIILIAYLYDKRFSELSALKDKLDCISDDKFAQLAIIFLLQTTLTPQVLQQFRDLEKDLRLHNIIKPENNEKNPLVIEMEMDEDGNPRWVNNNSDDVLDKHIHRMAALHKKGGDFNYSSSVNMLGNDFFTKELANWFIPFSENHTAIEGTLSDKDNNQLQKIIHYNIGACDIDSYCMALVAKELKRNNTTEANIENQLPNELKDIDLSEQKEIIDNIKKESANDEHRLQNYIRCLYRFFRHNNFQFENIISEIQNITTSTVFDIVFSIPEKRTEVAKMLIDLHLYSESAALLETIVNADNYIPSAEEYQRLGFAYQKLENNEKAIEAYSKALIIEDDEWTSLRLAKLQHQLGNDKDALLQLDLLLQTDENNRKALMLKADCLMSLKQYEEAYSLFCQLDVLFPDEINIWRGLSWCALQTNHLQIAQSYLFRLTAEEDVDAIDLINFGHLLFLSGKRNDALSYYLQAYTTIDMVQQFFNLFRQDRSLLREHGVSREELILLEDSLLMKINELKSWHN